MPTILLPQGSDQENHDWGIIKDWEGPYFQGGDPFSAVLAEINSADAAAQAGINNIRQHFLNLVPALPTLEQLAAKASIDAAFDGALTVKKAVVTTVKAAIAGITPELHLVYLANGGCPLDQNPGATVELHDWDFDPEDLPSFDTNLSITLNLPPATPVFSIAFPLPMQWKHGFVLTPRKVRDRVQESWYHTTSPPGEHRMNRVETTHSFILRYKAQYQLGPIPGSIDKMWIATQTVSSVWCR